MNTITISATTTKKLLNTFEFFVFFSSFFISIQVSVIDRTTYINRGFLRFFFLSFSVIYVLASHGSPSNSLHNVQTPQQKQTLTFPNYGSHLKWNGSGRTFPQTHENHWKITDVSSAPTIFKWALVRIFWFRFVLLIWYSRLAPRRISVF